MTHAPGRRLAATTWQGKASDHRRRQVLELAPVPVQDGPTGPVDRDGAAPRTDGVTLSSMDAVWLSVVDVLDALGSETFALLCSPSGFPVKGYGYAHRDLVTAGRAAGRAFELRRDGTVSDAGVETVEMTVGPAQTVMIAIPSAQGEHLLAVTTEGASMPVLRAWGCHVASQMSRVLAQP
jgi:hypothetical protein